MTLFTQSDKRDKIRSQLIYEMGLPEQPKKTKDKSTTAISKRHAFIERNKKWKKIDGDLK